MLAEWTALITWFEAVATVGTRAQAETRALAEARAEVGTATRTVAEARIGVRAEAGLEVPTERKARRMGSRLTLLEPAAP